MGRAYGGVYIRSRTGSTVPISTIYIPPMFQEIDATTGLVIGKVISPDYSSVSSSILTGSIGVISKYEYYNDWSEPVFLPFAKNQIAAAESQALQSSDTTVFDFPNQDVVLGPGEALPFNILVKSPVQRIITSGSIIKGIPYYDRIFLNPIAGGNFSSDEYVVGSNYSSSLPADKVILGFPSGNSLRPGKKITVNGGPVTLNLKLINTRSQPVEWSDSRSTQAPNLPNPTPRPFSRYQGGSYSVRYFINNEEVTPGSSGSLPPSEASDLTVVITPKSAYHGGFTLAFSSNNSATHHFSIPFELEIVDSSPIFINEVVYKRKIDNSIVTMPDKIPWANQDYYIEGKITFLKDYSGDLNLRTAFNDSYLDSDNESNYLSTGGLSYDAIHSTSDGSRNQLFYGYGPNRLAFGRYGHLEYAVRWPRYYWDENSALPVHKLFVWDTPTFEFREFDKLTFLGTNNIYYDNEAENLAASLFRFRHGITKLFFAGDVIPYKIEGGFSGPNLPRYPKSVGLTGDSNNFQSRIVVDSAVNVSHFVKVFDITRPWVLPANGPAVVKINRDGTTYLPVQNIGSGTAYNIKLVILADQGSGGVDKGIEPLVFSTWVTNESNLRTLNPGQTGLLPLVWNETSQNFDPALLPITRYGYLYYETTQENIFFRSLTSLNTLNPFTNPYPYWENIGNVVEGNIYFNYPNGTDVKILIDGNDWQVDAIGGG
jgi:hypothetical protein